MDSAFTAIELCAGYGGICLGLKRVIPNLRVVAYSEIEGFACANLVAKIEKGHLDAAPVWTDVKTFPAKDFYGKVHLVTGGYPCQPFSHAGQRQGEDDPRHLWPHIRAVVGSARPLYCFLENVEGHVTLGLSTVISDLGKLGYRVTWGIFSASEIGAPHERKRVFILGRLADGEGGRAESTEQPEQRNGAKQPVRVELNDIGEIKEMSDGTKYQVTPQGWKKLTTAGTGKEGR